MERIKTAHLYTTVSVVSWAMLQSHCGYDVCDRLRIDNIHKSGEGDMGGGLFNLRALKSISVSEFVNQFDKVCINNSVDYSLCVI